MRHRAKASIPQRTEAQMQVRTQWGQPTHERMQSQACLSYAEREGGNAKRNIGGSVLAPVVPSGGGSETPSGGGSETPSGGGRRPAEAKTSREVTIISR